MKELDLVQIVDPEGMTIASVEKLQAHESGGVLHRAVSVLIFDAESRLLLQRRSPAKYHFAGLWANSCCTHPSPSESIMDAARRALEQELGIAPEVREITTLSYTAHDASSGYTEREYDHVLIGVWGSEVHPHSDEVQALDWVTGGDLAEWLRSRPAEIVPWLSPILATISTLPDARLAKFAHLRTFIHAFQTG